MINLDAALDCARFALGANSNGGLYFLQMRAQVLFALNGNPAFLLFNAVDPTGQFPALQIWISTDRKLVSPIFSVSIGSSPDIVLTTSILQNVKTSILSRSNVVLANWMPVVYRYPRVGILCTQFDPSTGESEQLLYDFYTAKQVALNEIIDDSTPYDLLNFVSSKPEFSTFAVEFDVGGVNPWNLELDAIRSIISQSPDIQAGVDGLIVEQKLGKSFGNTSASFELVPQIDETHCALASAQMITTFFGANANSQVELEPTFNYKLGKGVTTDDQVTGYDLFLKGLGYDANVDFSPTFNEIRKQIDSGLPVRTAIAGHARCCCGYRQRCIEYSGTELILSDLLIYDPYPPTIGQIRWEATGSIKLIDSIFFSK